MPLGVVNDKEFEAELANSCVVVPSNSIPNSESLTETEKEKEKDEEHHAVERGDSASNDFIPLSPGEIVKTQTRGRANGDVNTPLALQQLIGESALSSRKESVELASLLGLSPSSASAYANGASSTASYNKPKYELESYLNRKKTTIAKRAGVKLLSALDNITDDKMEHASLATLAAVAKSMSGVIKDMEPPVVNPNAGNTFNGPSIVMFAPPLVSENKFETITVQE